MSVDLKPPPDVVPVEQDPRPVVDLPRPGLPGALIAVVGAVAALLLFLFLDAQRRRAALPGAEDAPAVALAPPPPLVLPPRTAPEPQLVAPVEPVVATAPPVVRPAPALPPQQGVPAPPPPAPPPLMRPLPPLRPTTTSPRPALSEPALVVDASGSGLTVGTLIPAVLETPIDTSRPGLARAIVSQDARSADGQTVLVPRGSRLIGEYQSNVRAGQNRVLVNWTTLIRPDGGTVRIASPAADSLGGAGIPGKANGFFLTRFLSSALQTALSVGGNLATGGRGNTVIVGLPASQANPVAGQGLVSGDSSRRKISVKQGTAFNVFVAREVDLSGSEPAAANAAAKPAPAAPL